MRRLVHKLTILAASLFLTLGSLAAWPERPRAAEELRTEAETTPDGLVASEAGSPGRVEMMIVKKKPYVVVKWTRLTTNCKGYEIHYSPKKKFPENESTIHQCGPKVSSLSIPLGEGKLFIRMRAYNYANGKYLYGSFTPKKRVKL